MANYRRPCELLALMVIRAIPLAGFVAYVLHEALDGIGLDTVVSVVTVAATILAALVAIEFFSKKLGAPQMKLSSN